jgi:Arylsulfotransferase (ASST)
MRAGGRATLILTLAAVALAAPAAAAATVKLKTSPGLKPSFKTSVPDYVSRCEPGNPLRFSVTSAKDDRVAIGSTPAKGGDFTVDVSAQTGASVTVAVTSNGHRSTHHVRCLPLDFPGWKVHRHRKPQSQWYVVTPIGPHNAGYMTVFDARGVPLWWMHSGWYGPWDGKLLPNGNLMWSRQFNNYFGVNPKEAWEEHALDGQTVRVLQTEGSPTDMHDLEVLPNGNYLLDTYRRRSNVDLRPYGPEHAEVYDGEIQEQKPDGTVIWSWNSKNHIKLSENLWWDDINKAQNRQPADKRYYDLVHINSMEPDGGGIIVSARFLDAVFRINRKTKDITWKVGGTKRPWSLEVKDDPLAKRPLGGNHDARLYKDHTLTVYDNGASGGPATRRRPRLVRYRIDTAKGTAKFLEGLDEGAIPLSGWGGSARKLPGGNWVANWGGSNLVTERTPLKKPVLELEFLGDRYSYRAFPVPPGRLSAQQLRKGMDAILSNGRGEVAPAR